jgi:2-polyprenyl-3-methyl-5-hydroxy-6-metoxy-1,4-benzoquinol methylase
MMQCAWCGENKKKIFHARVRWENLDSTWYRCANCGSLMILPIPPQKLMQKIYENNYRSRVQPHGIDYRVRYSKKYRPTVFNGYTQSLLDVNIDIKRVKSVLDFGCADGIFLEFVKKYFSPQTVLYGTDISADMLGAAKKRGLNVISLADLPSLKMKFDLITLWDVLEHSEDPSNIVTILRKMLTPKGRIFIQTPRVGVLADALGKEWEHLLPIQHVNLASKEGMRKFIQRMKLEIDGYKSFGANAPATAVAEPYKKVFDQLAKILDFGSEQILSLKHKI